MTAVTLPASPGPRQVAWQPVDFGTTLQGALGGMGQRVNRLGNRWSVNVTMPVLTPIEARAWSAALTSGLRNGVLWKVRQVGTPTGSPGTPLVAGGSQAGSALDIDGLNAGYAMRAGQFFSLVVSSRRYLYQVAADVQAASGGTATLAIEPPLRVSPADNDTVELAVPYIEGLLSAPQGWSLDPDRLARGFQFTITEQR